MLVPYYKLPYCNLCAIARVFLGAMTCAEIRSDWVVLEWKARVWEQGRTLASMSRIAPSLIIKS